MPGNHIQRMCTALLKLSSMQDEGTRTLYLNEAQAELGRSLSANRHTEPRHDLTSILRACEREPGGLTAFLDVVESFHEGASAVSEVQQIAAEWLYEQRLIILLAELPREAVATAVAAVTGKSASTDMPLQKLVHSVGWRTLPRWGVPTMLVLADLLGYETDTNVDLRRWFDDVAFQVGVGQARVTQVRSETARYRQQLDALSDVIVPDSDQDDPESGVRKTITIDESPAVVSQSVIRGGIPARNPYFTGREQVLAELEASLHAQNRASVLPETTLHGYGGVGKTQVAVEYAYLRADEYQLIWWVPAEEPGAVRSSLSALAGRLGLPISHNMEQTVRSVLDALAYTTSLSWLLVYDNADEPGSLDNLVPSSGGHVIITSRNPDWAAATGATLEVDVFSRAESKLMLRKRRPEISESDADRLAEKLGDLPLALEQAASWLITTMTSVDDYLAEFDRQSRKLLDDGRPRQYPSTVLTFVALALNRLRETAPAAARLLELMAFLGPEPISTTLLWAGRGADIDEPLHSALQERNDIARAVRDLGRFGLARVDSASKRMQVHRLVQLVLREELTDERREEARRNARHLLAAANPGYPDDPATWPRHAEINPHIRVAGLIEGGIDGRRAVLDQLRYVYSTGDLEGCRDLAEEILASWDRPIEAGGQGPDDGLTLLAIRRYADALRSLGDFPRAQQAGLRAWEEMRRALGDEHEYTLGAANGVAADMRIAGDFQGARDLDERNLELCRQVLGEGDPSTVRALNSVAVDRRMLGDFQGAYETDVEMARQARSALGEGDALTFFAIAGQARDLYSLGRYRESLDLQREALPAHTALLGPEHAHVLMAQGLVAISLRKTGQLADALTLTHDNYRSHGTRFGPNHAQTLAATMSYANALRATGDPTNARSLAVTAHTSYEELYGPRHPLTLSAAVNLAIIHRALGDDLDARALDEATLEIMREVLGSAHPYLLCLMSNYGNDLARAHRLTQARELSSQLLEVSTRVRGVQHPYTLHCATNAALDMIDTGDEADGLALLTDTVAALERVLGKNHPETEAARKHKRAECDIEPPPT